MDTIVVINENFDGCGDTSIVEELNELQLALVGGGIGETVL